VLFFALAACFLMADDPSSTKAEARPDKPPAAAERPAEAPPVNLLGRTSTQSGESRRNENVQFNLIDNNAMKEFRQRMGTTATIAELTPDRNAFAAEFGNPPAAPLHLPAAKPPGGIHGQAFWTHSNSVFSARSFFQAGGVQPARENNFGLQAGVMLWKGAWLSVDGSRQLLRGQVNGNVLVPLPAERTPLATDPQVRALISRWLAAYPDALPNRTDIDPRALNTNAPQQLDTDAAVIRLDQTLGPDRLTARWSFTNQRVDAFQFVAGQNPDTNTKNHSARLTWQRAFSAATVGEFSLGFDRVHSLLAPEPNAVGPQVQIGTAFTTLGPGAGIPIDRVWNRYRSAAAIRQTRGRHRLHFGGELTRFQSNGREASSNRGNYYFRNDFGRDAITNFRLGIPNRYSVGIGSTDRAFRNWEQQYFLGDTIQAGAWTVSLGLRYQPQTGPFEVHGLNEIPYRCDCNNLAPQFGLARKLAGGVVRAGYGLFYNDIYPTTFMQVRWNPPNFLKPEVQAPDILDPLANADLSPTGRAIVVQVPENLVAPYSHHYNLGWQRELPGRWRLEAGYVGSRSHKLLLLWHSNRAQPVPGIPQTTATINERRADPRFFEIRPVMNGSRAYFDAGRLTLTVPRWRRLQAETSYWWSKAIDTGGTYLNTAAGDDARQGHSQSEFILQADLKAVSEFDQSHSLLTRINYELPLLTTAPRALRATLGGWTFGGIWLAKTGMPFTVIAGSDGPGFGNVDGTNGDRPNIVDPAILGRAAKHPDSTPLWLVRSAFRFIAPTDARGNLGNNVFRRAGILNVNASLSRTWTIANERAITLRADSINLTNSPQFAAPNFDLTSPAFGKITNTLNDGRAFRFTLQARF
jgi:hypothetical protein